MVDNWTTDSWKALEARHMPAYPDAAALADAEAQLRGFPPLVFAGEVERLKADLAKVSRGEAFLLQGGDCAESFREFTTDNIIGTFKVLLQMAVVLTFAGRKPVVKVARMAGQFAKPRSSPTEKIGDVELPSYLGDNINGVEFTPEARIPDPQRMVRAYHQSAATLNLLRALTRGGYASLRNVHDWTMDFIGRQDWAEDQFHALASRITDSVEFMQSCGLATSDAASFDEATLYSSHEALLLPYEQAMARQATLEHPKVEPGSWYGTSGHFLWIGDRTRFEGSAHVEFLRGLRNPIGVKCGPSLDSDVLLRLLDTLNPTREEGRITLIARFGDDKVLGGLPRLVRAVKASDHPVVWSCDPMHGNVITSESGKKTRPFDRILREIEGFMDVHAAEGTVAGGIHLEMTGRNVTECIGGGINITDAGLLDRYDTQCDPRLNQAQSLEMAFRLADYLNPASKAGASGDAAQAA